MKDAKFRNQMCSVWHAGYLYIRVIWICKQNKCFVCLKPILSRGETGQPYKETHKLTYNCDKNMHDMSADCNGEVTDTFFYFKRIHHQGSKKAG